MMNADATAGDSASLEAPELVGRHVRLEPLGFGHTDELAAAAEGDRSTYEWTPVPDGPEETRGYIEWLVGLAARREVAPYVQRRVSDGCVVGATRFLEPRWPLGRRDPDEVEIGGTWLSADAQRTALNTEAKLLLLTHAFETWNVQRVAICTDARNEQSRRAIERIGADIEGVLRRHRPSAVSGDGNVLRDTAVYAIVEPAWPAVRRLLEGRLATDGGAGA